MAKNKAGKLPKQIGSVKLPKRLRKRGNKLLGLLRHPLAADIAAAALIAAATAIKDNQKLRAAAAKARDQVGDAVAGLGQGAASLGGAAAARADRPYRDRSGSAPDSRKGDGGGRKAH